MRPLRNDSFRELLRRHKEEPDQRLWRIMLVERWTHEVLSAPDLEVLVDAAWSVRSHLDELRLIDVIHAAPDMALTRRRQFFRYLLRRSSDLLAILMMANRPDLLDTQSFGWVKKALRAGQLGNSEPKQLELLRALILAREHPERFQRQFASILKRVDPNQAGDVIAPLITLGVAPASERFLRKALAALEPHERDPMSEIALARKDGLAAIRTVDVAGAKEALERMIEWAPCAPFAGPLVVDLLLPATKLAKLRPTCRRLVSIALEHPRKNADLHRIARQLEPQP
ncbi:MAG: hypothetical protein Q8N26_17700 [Myxococcales bacterium]|nr:hypothetical protein [Myxococcales bacterium]